MTRRGSGPDRGRRRRPDATGVPSAGAWPATKGAEATLTFTGTAVTITGRYAADGGRAEVTPRRQARPGASTRGFRSARPTTRCGTSTASRRARTPCDWRPPARPTSGRPARRCSCAARSSTDRDRRRGLDCDDDCVVGTGSGQVESGASGRAWLDGRPWLAGGQRWPARRRHARRRRRRSPSIKAARLIDGQGGAPLANPVVVIEDDRIARVGAGLPVPAGAEVIDLGGATLLPGLIDCHTHLTGQPGENYYDDMFRKSPIDGAVVAHVYAQAHARGRVHDRPRRRRRRARRRRHAQRHQPGRDGRSAHAGGHAGGERDRRARRPVRVLAVPVDQGARTTSPTASTRSASWSGPKSSTAPT